jgi:beta-lactamase superfamily II metal-dependent hydrolase
MSPRARNVPAVLSRELHVKDDFTRHVSRSELVYFVLNVGDGDLQLFLLPARSDGSRRAVVVDVGRPGKLPALIDGLRDAKLIPQIPEDGCLFPLVVGSHPHDDHISGMPEFLKKWGHAVREYWEPGYWHTSSAYQKTMQLLEDSDPHIQHTQPTSGTTRFVGRLKILVLSPAVGVRRRFDTYGVDLNDSSISLRIDFPASQVEQRDRDRRYVGVRGKTRTFVLGADSLLASWAQVLVDFPELYRDNAPAAQAIGEAQGPDALRAEIFKVPHHASKHGLNLGLVEAVKPKLSLVSSVGGGGKYNFPHLVTLEALREGLEATTLRGKERSPDWKLGIHYTSVRDSRGALGSMAIVVAPTGTKREIWRFRDEPADPIDLDNAWRYKPTRRSR